MGKIVEDYKDIFGMWSKTYCLDNDKSNTVSGQKWRDMRWRCKAGGSEQLRKSSYIGCTVDDNFKDFQFFTEWHRKQTGYGLSGYHLDKDVLSHGNKIYSATTCALIPQALNNFTTSRKTLRGNFKQGVSWNKSCSKFQVRINISGKDTHIGLFKTEDEAYASYKSAKEAEAYRWYERLKAGEFIVDERVIERMRTWTLEE